MGKKKKLDTTRRLPLHQSRLMDHSYHKVIELVEAKTIQDYQTLVGYDVSDTLAALKEIQHELALSRLREQRERILLRISYEERLAPLLAVRRAIVEGTPLPDNNPPVDPAGVPNFWNRVFYNCGVFTSLPPTEFDTELLASLVDLQVKTLPPELDEAHLRVAVHKQLTFVFRANPHLATPEVVVDFRYAVNEDGAPQMDTETMRVTPLQWTGPAPEGGLFGVLNAPTNDDAHDLHMLTGLDFDAIGHFFERNLFAEDVDEDYEE